MSNPSKTVFGSTQTGLEKNHLLSKEKGNKPKRAVIYWFVVPHNDTSNLLLFPYSACDFNVVVTATVLCTGKCEVEL